MKRLMWRIVALFRRARITEDVNEEISAHLEFATADYVARGLSPEDARRAALRSFGGVSQAKQKYQESVAFPLIEDLLRDSLYAVRGLRRNPGVALVAVATIALAIAANTALFSLVDPLMFRDLPVRDPTSLVEFTFQFPRDPPLNSFSLANYAGYRDDNHVFSDIFGFAPLVTRARPGDEPIAAEVVTGNFFQGLGVRTALGRLLEPSDDQLGGPATAVLSWSYWQLRFHGDARVLGTSIDIEDTRAPAPMHATVVGVAADGFTGVVVGYPSDVWASLSTVPDAMRSRGEFSLMARLKPGVSITQARAEMRVLDRARIEALAKRDPQWLGVPIDVTSARTGLSTPLKRQFGGPLYLLLAMVGGVLLLACVNIGGLLLARGAARQQEMAVRISLGAGRVRIVRQVLTESLILALLGGILGFIGARIGATILMRLLIAGTRAPGQTPSLHVPLDARILGFTVAITLIAALLFGILPALTTCVSSPVPPLRPAVGAPRRTRRLFGDGLVIAQVAISVALLSVSQLSIAHLRHLRDRSLGFDRDRVLLVSVNVLPTRTRDQLLALYGEVMPRLQAIADVRAVAASATTPIAPGAASRFLRAEGFDEPAQGRRRVAMNWVSPNYFATYRTSLLAGRDFRDGDIAQPRRVIINQAVARHYFADRDPIGRHVWLENDPDPYEIVGVAADAKYQEVRDPAPPTVYTFAPIVRGSTTFSLRTDATPTATAADARRAVEKVFGPDSVRGVTTLTEQVDSALVPERLLALLGGYFGAAGALLAAIGLYGLLAYTVARRTAEIGVRMALGASLGDIVWMVVRHALLLVLTGIAVGLPAAFWGKRVAGTLVDHLTAGGTVPIVVGASALLAVAVLAAYPPVRRATRVDPIIALRAD